LEKAELAEAAAPSVFAKNMMNIVELDLLITEVPGIEKLRGARGRYF
jgi:hypothetical protein